jgi:uncharacterized membrane protein
MMDALNQTIDRNIAAILRHEAESARAAGWSDRVADGITAFAGSMPFVVVHLLVFGSWIAVNLGWITIIPAFDPTLVILAMAASVEAIFISTFVLISQNRMAAKADRQAKLTLQIALLAEHETTRLMQLTSAIAHRLDVRTAVDGEVEQLQGDVALTEILRRIESEEQGAG